jgi:uncharacterized membrane protein YccC
MSSLEEDGLRAGSSPTQWDAALIGALRAAGPLLLFGLRLWASVCLALYVAFWLELDNAFWAGTTAAIVCQPQLGASLRKGWFRMIGTVVGAVAIVVLTACFPQERAAFLVGLALWCAAAAFVATSVLRNFAAYAASLAGYTAAIIAYDQLGATGGPNGDAFMLAIFRVSEIWLGIVCAGIVLAGTDFGGAGRRLAAVFAAVSAEIVDRFGATLAPAGSMSSDTQQPVRRELIRKVVALDPVVDQAIGESSTLRYHSSVLRGALEGLMVAITAWRSVAVRLARLPDRVAREEADALLRNIPQQLRSVSGPGEPSPWMADPLGMRRLCSEGARKLIAMPVGTPSLRLFADQSARVLVSLIRTLDALALLTGKPERPDAGRRTRLYVADWWPAFVNAGRTFVAISAAEIFWIVTAWPNGAFFIGFTAITVILLAPAADAAYALAYRFALGSALGAIGAAIIEFAVLPKVETFIGFSIVLGLYLIPVGALVAQPWQTPVFIAMTYQFVPVLAPANQMTYDTVQFYNTALAIVGGTVVGALSFRLLPPLSPAFRTRRLLALTLRGLRRLAANPRWLREDWEGRMHSCIAALPDAATPLQRAQIVTALSVGSEIINLRRIAPQLGFGPELEAALAALAEGDSAAANARLAAIDSRLGSLPDSDPQARLALRARALILGIGDALEQHRAYFDGGAPA